jgi:uncharacterized protein (TIGR00661 family)
VIVYGKDAQPANGNIEFRPFSNTQFVAELADAYAVFSTAGNQLISECMHFGKPMLLMPEDSLEQRLNADMIERMGCGLAAKGHGVTAEQLRQFLADRDKFAANITASTDGQATAVTAIEKYAEELAGRSGVASGIDASHSPGEIV